MFYYKEGVFFNGRGWTSDAESGAGILENCTAAWLKAVKGFLEPLSTTAMVVSMDDSNIVILVDKSSSKSYAERI